MEQVFIVGLVGLTSLGAYLVGVRGCGWPARGLGRAATRVLEGIGFTLMFLLLNIAAGVLFVLGLRAGTGAFLPVYVMNDPAWVVLSLFQGLAFQWWRAAR